MVNQIEMVSYLVKILCLVEHFSVNKKLNLNLQICILSGGE